MQTLLHTYFSRMAWICFASASSTLANTRATTGPIAFDALVAPLAVAVGFEVKAGAEGTVVDAAADPPITGLSALARPLAMRCDRVRLDGVAADDGSCC